MDTVLRSPVTLAGKQEPLLHVAQLRVGSYLTGVAAQHIWHLLEIRAETLLLQRLPVPREIHRGEHHFTRIGEGGDLCACGLACFPPTIFLPLKPGKARIHIIHPEGEVLQPDPFSVYVAEQDAHTHTILCRDNHWSSPVPILPQLYKLWEIPMELREIASRSAEFCSAGPPSILGTVDEGPEGEDTDHDPDTEADNDGP